MNSSVQKSVFTIFGQSLEESVQYGNEKTFLES